MSGIAGNKNAPLLQTKARIDFNATFLDEENDMSAQIRSETILITPEIAKGFLEKNHGNRPISKARVTELKRCLINNQWALTHQGIALSPYGKVLDGQHRLAAIIEAQTPALMMVTFNVPDSAFEYIDCGQKRSMRLRLSADKDAVEVASFFAYFGSSQRAHVDISVVKKILIAADDYLSLIKAVAPSKIRGLTSASARAALLMSLIKGKDPTYSLRLYRDFSLGRTESLPPIGHSVIRQVMRGDFKLQGGQDGQAIHYSRIRVALNVENRFKQVLRVCSNTENDSKAEIKSLVAEIMSGIPLPPCPSSLWALKEPA